MKKIKFIFSTIAIFMFFCTTLFNVSAMVMPEYMPPITDGVFGQNQYYSVVYDGEGEAAVGAKLLIQNNGKEDIDSTVIEIPGTGIRLIRAVQEVYNREQYCSRWGNQICVEKGAYGCLEYEENCIDWRWRSKTYEPSYYTLEPEMEELSESVKYTFNFEKPLGEQEQSAILLYYKVNESAQKKLGVFSFNFETAKMDYDISNVRVAINVQEGLHLKGGEAETQYRSNAIYSDTVELEAPVAMGVQSKALSSFSNQITHVNGYTKTTSGLDPWESFAVEGKYAESRSALYIGAIIGWIVGTLIFLGGISSLVWWLTKRAPKKRKTQTINKTSRPEILPLKVIGTGIGVAIAMIILITLSSLLMQVISNNINYQYRTPISLLVILFNGIIVLAGIFGPSLYFGIKHGAAKGVWVLATIIISLFIFAIIAVFVSVSMSGGLRPIYY
jgi:hypothetical protein